MRPRLPVFMMEDVKFLADLFPRPKWLIEINKLRQLKEREGKKYERTLLHLLSIPP